MKAADSFLISKAATNKTIAKLRAKNMTGTLSIRAGTKTPQMQIGGSSRLFSIHRFETPDNL